MPWGYRFGIAACIGLLSMILPADVAAQAEVTVYEQTFDSLGDLNIRLLQGPVSMRHPSVQIFQTWSLSSDPEPGRLARLPRFSIPPIFTGANGSYFVGATYYGVGYVITDPIDASGQTNLRLRLEMAASQEGVSRGRMDSRNHFEAGEYVRLYVNGRVLDIFEGGNPLRLDKLFRGSSALTSRRTGKTIPTNFGEFEYDLSTFIAENGLNPSSLQIYIIAKTSNEFVGFDNLRIVADAADVDGCPNDPNKTAPGACGCGTADTDTDGDGTPDCQDTCSLDRFKIQTGVCGCAIPETDSDGDGTPDCIDSCDNDPGKTEAGICGCGVSDGDSDGDGAIDCREACPNDPKKFEKGQCGCGIIDIDSDTDGVADCNDECISDPEKSAPGICGCGTADADSDRDGALDCNDECPTHPGGFNACGQCGVAPDSDGDGTPDCQDGCPTDGAKTAEGVCGCGEIETGDMDGDGIADCNDQCPADQGEINACGVCGVAADADGDGTPDCNDQCSEDPAKTQPGNCGCGVEETESCGEQRVECFIGGDAIGPDPSLTTGRGGFASDMTTGGAIVGIPGLEITADGVSRLKELQMVVFTGERFDSVTDFTTYRWRLRIWTRDAFFTQPEPISSSPDMMEFQITPVGDIVCKGVNETPPCVPESSWGVDHAGKDAWLMTFDLSSVPGLQDPLPAGQYVIGAYAWVLTSDGGDVYIQTSEGDGPLATLLTPQEYVTEEDPIFNDYVFIPADLNNWAMTLTEMVPESRTGGRICK